MIIWSSINGAFGYWRLPNPFPPLKKNQQNMLYSDRVQKDI